MEQKRAGKGNTRDMLYIALSVALITICAWLCIPAVVPFTMQTFGVFMAAGLLGKRRGVTAVAVYLLLGMIGIPVFSGFRGGVGVLMGNTGGYLIGFIFTAWIVGMGAGRTSVKPLRLVLLMVLGQIVCYAFGTLWLYLGFINGATGGGLLAALGIYVFPFLLQDAFKIALAAVLVQRLRGKINGL